MTCIEKPIHFVLCLISYLTQFLVAGQKLNTGKKKVIYTARYSLQEKNELDN